MHSKSKKGGVIASFGLCALVVATIAGTSCGGSKSSGFPVGANGSSSGVNGDGGGYSEDGALCFGGSCDTNSFDGSLGSVDGGNVQMKMDAGVSIDTCTGGTVAASTVTALEAGGPVDPAMKWLYPYDQTVFPGGLISPVLQWSAQSGGADAVLVSMKSQLFSYKGCFGKTSPTQIPLPSAAWSGAWNQSNGSTDPVTVELTTMAGGKVSGPITEHWTFALGSLKGLIYYNTYTSPQVNNNGAVMVIKPGAATPTPVLAITGASPVGKKS